LASRRAKITVDVPHSRTGRRRITPGAAHFRGSCALRRASGQVVFINSGTGRKASPDMASYSASKFAVLALTESLRAELEMLKAPIGVSLLAPGPVKSGIFNNPFGAQSDAAAQAFVDNMRSLLTQHGLTPDQFAERVFAGIAQGQYWLIPQPEAFDEPFRQRNEDIAARRNPRLPW